MKQLKSPCEGCPFSKRTEPGQLGGSTTDVFIGHIVADMWLPCHSDPDYKGEESSGLQVSQCAGAAIFRSNIEISECETSNLLLPADDGEKVFATVAKFYHHHDCLEWDEAEDKSDFDRLNNLGKQALRTGRVDRKSVV